MKKLGTIILTLGLLTSSAVFANDNVETKSASESLSQEDNSMENLTGIYFSGENE